ncbi:response regulator [Desulfoferrobacter suflitae]|uniref:response regulator n=1 Tax=Desulfoferrobacter suflitae TaxID=2865782 RepID=UPI0021641D61|nr:response regulator transcription factor [Desulfoferrobacter suflitae]MCK8600964.1 response regulator transcription factor [Desulfoferrobacter suflitae]
MSVRLLIADDHNIVRDGLRALLETQQNLQVIAEAENGRKAVRLVRELSPDVVIIDVGMPGLNGIDATRQIVAEANETKVIALSMHSDRRFVAQMFKAGAAAYLLKDCAFEELVQAVDVVVAGQIYLSPEIAGAVIEDYVRHISRTDSSGFSVLTAREREVLQLLAEGKATKEIAAELFVSVKTIETHRQQIMHKLKVGSLADLIKYAIREGITFLDA